MKVSSLFDLIADSKDLLDLFDGVETPEQMVSALERLKRRENAEELLDCVTGLRMSVTKALADSLEMSAVIDDEDDGDDDLADELEKIASESSPTDSQFTSDESPSPETKK